MFIRAVYCIIMFSLMATVPSSASGLTADETRKVFEEGKALFEKTSSHPDREKALEKFKLALAASQETGDKKLEAACLGYIGSIYKSSGEHAKALTYYEKSLDIRTKLGDAQGEATTLGNIGDVYRFWGKYAEALENFNKSLEIKRKIGDIKGEGDTLNNMGILFSSQGQYARALQYYEKALNSQRKSANLKGEGRTLGNMGEVYRHWSKYEKALDCYGKSLEIKRRIGDAAGEGITLNNMGLVFAVWGEYDKALEHYDKALELGRKVGDPQGESSALINMGEVFRAQGRYVGALDYYEKALEIKRRIGDAKGESATLNNIGLLHAARGEYAKALESYKQSLEIKRRIRDVRGIGVIFNNVGIVNKLWGRYAKALDHYEKGLAVFKNIGDLREQGTTLANMGEIYMVWGKYAKALDYYEQSLEIKRRIGEVKGEAVALNSIGFLFSRWGQYDKALDHYEKSLVIRKNIGDGRGEGAVLLNIAQVLATTGRYDEAVTRFNTTLEIYSIIGIPVKGVQDSIGKAYLEKGDLATAEPYLKQANFHSSLGRLALLKGDYKEAQDRYQKLLKRAEENRNTDYLFTGYTGLARVHESLQEYRKAEKYYQKGIESVESLRSELAPAERENFFAVKINGFWRTDPYEGLARVLHKMHRPLEALKQSEFTKARLFSEAISRRVAGGVSASTPDEILQQDHTLNDELAALSKSLQQAYEKADKETVASLEPQVREKKLELESHIDTLRKKFPLVAATKYPQPMDVTQSALKDDEWCLSYDVTDSALLIHLTRGKALVKSVLRPISSAELDKLVRAVRTHVEIVPGRDSVEDKLASFDFTSSKRLADVLLDGIIQEIPPSTPIIVIPDGSLGVFPFEMLVLDVGGRISFREGIPVSEGAEFFGHRNPISYYQSITALTLARLFSTHKTAKKQILVVADPVFEMRDARVQQEEQGIRVVGAEGRFYKDLMASIEEGKVGNLRFGRLPKTGDLARGLSNSFKNACTVYMGTRASKELFMKEIAPRLISYERIVFATHGYVGTGLPGINEPVLVFSLVPPGTDGYLRLTEVMGLKMGADMVALTACQTGIGKEVSGEGVMGMGRAFQFAGARSVLTSLWSVAEQSSIILVERFFHYLKENKTKLQALQSAREDIRNQGFDHPFFWASFILVGETQ